MYATGLDNVLITLAHKIDAASRLDLDADQIALVRLFKRLGRESMTIKEIEQNREGQTPWFKAYLQQIQKPKNHEVKLHDITTQTLRTETRNTLEREILNNYEVVTVDYHGDQTMFDTTKAWIMYLNADDVNEVFGQFTGSEWGMEWVKQYMSRPMGHPKPHPYAGTNKLVIGWVRYTELEDDTAWVHEVQTDLKHVFGARHISREEFEDLRGHADPFEADRTVKRMIRERSDAFDALLDKLEWLLLKTFMADEHSRFKRIVMPTAQYRQSVPDYHGYETYDVPALYNELPRKLRFKKQSTENLGLNDVPAGDVWVMGSIVTAKFWHDKTAVCGHCFRHLRAAAVVEFPKNIPNRHLYTIGQMLECRCGKSKVWTNSIRNEQAFIRYAEEELPSYMAGFCNDKFCGFTFKPLRVIENGREIPELGGKSVDVFGNPEHPTNDRILHVDVEWDAHDGVENLERWYKERLDRVREFAAITAAAAEDPSAHQIDMSDPQQTMEETVKTPADQMRLAINTLESEFSIADGDLITTEDIQRMRELTSEIRKLVEAFESKQAVYRAEHPEKPRSGDS